jgi:hypothetical protein
MNLVAIKTPTTRVAPARQALELFDASLRIVATGELLQVVANQFIQAFAEDAGFFSGSGDQLLVNGQGNIHEHSICVHVCCVKRAR